MKKIFCFLQLLLFVFTLATPGLSYAQSSAFPKDRYLKEVIPNLAKDLEIPPEVFSNDKELANFLGNLPDVWEVRKDEKGKEAAAFTSSYLPIILKREVFRKLYQSYEKGEMERWKLHAVMNKLNEDKYFYRPKEERIKYLHMYIPTLKALKIVAELENAQISSIEKKQVPEISYKRAALLSLLVKREMADDAYFWETFFTGHDSKQLEPQNNAKTKYFTQAELNTFYYFISRGNFSTDKYRGFLDNKSKPDWTTGESFYLKLKYQMYIHDPAGVRGWLQETQQASWDLAMTIPTLGGNLATGIPAMVGFTMETNKETGGLEFSEKRAVGFGTLMVIAGAVGSKLNPEGAETAWARAGLSRLKSIERAKVPAGVQEIPVEQRADWLNIGKQLIGDQRLLENLLKPQTELYNSEIISRSAKGSFFRKIISLYNHFGKTTPDKFSHRLKTVTEPDVAVNFSQFESFFNQNRFRLDPEFINVVLDSKLGNQKNALKWLAELDYEIRMANISKLRVKGFPETQIKQMEFLPWLIRKYPELIRLGLEDITAGGTARNLLKMRELNKFSDIDKIFVITSSDGLAYFLENLESLKDFGTLFNKSLSRYDQPELMKSLMKNRSDLLKDFIVAKGREYNNANGLGLKDSSDFLLAVSPEIKVKTAQYGIWSLEDAEFIRGGPYHFIESFSRVPLNSEGQISRFIYNLGGSFLKVALMGLKDILNNVLRYINDDGAEIAVADMGKLEEPEELLARGVRFITENNAKITPQSRAALRGFSEEYYLSPNVPDEAKVIRILELSTAKGQHYLKRIDQVYQQAGLKSASPAEKEFMSVFLKKENKTVLMRDIWENPEKYIKQYQLDINPKDIYQDTWRNYRDMLINHAPHLYFQQKAPTP